jgi:hypothetical protein
MHANMGNSQIAPATTLPWWTLAALESAVRAFESQARLRNLLWTAAGEGLPRAVYGDQAQNPGVVPDEGKHWIRTRSFGRTVACHQSQSLRGDGVPVPRVALRLLAAG